MPRHYCVNCLSDITEESTWDLLILDPMGVIMTKFE